MLFSMLLFAQATGRMFRCSTVVTHFRRQSHRKPYICTHHSRIILKNQSFLRLNSRFPFCVAAAIRLFLL